MRSAKKPRRRSSRLRSALPLVSLDAVRNTLVDPTQWVCRATRSTDELWCCLQCGEVCCAERRLGAHSHETPALFLELNQPDARSGANAAVYCAASASLLSRDAVIAGGDVARAQALLCQVRNERSFLSKKVLLKKFELDAMQNSLAHWKNLLCARIFNTWRSVWTAARTAKRHSKEESEEGEHSSVMSPVRPFLFCLLVRSVTEF